MTKNKKKSASQFKSVAKRVFPFLLSSLACIALMALGSSNKNLRNESGSPIISAINDSSFVLTTDQLSESYIVADLANSINLPSVQTINENYTSIVMKYAATGSAGNDEVVTKPNIVDTSSLVRGIVKHEIMAGETLASIAAKYEGLTVDQLRWSNNLKTSVVTVGQVIYVPSVPGVLYTVKSGDTVAALATKYKSDPELIRQYNDLEESDGEVVVGVTIILPAGELPETERPEYVAPKPKPVYYSNTVRDSGVRYNTVEVNSSAYWRNMYYNGQGNPGAFGNCTWFAWHWRRNNMDSNYWIPSGVIGNAGTWTYMQWSRAFLINKTPAYGAVIQTSTGSPGHVGVVVGVVPGSHIVIEEMNYHGSCGYYGCGRNRVFRSHINWAQATGAGYNYIHSRY